MKNESSKTIFDLINSEQFRKRPNMYLGRNSISLLRIYMLGYDACERANGIKPSDTVPPYNLFYYWISKVYNFVGSLYWDGIILQNCNNDESLALETFFRRYDEFRKSKPIKIKTCELDNHSNQLILIEYSGGIGTTIHHMNGKIEMNERYFETTEEALKQIDQDYPGNVKWKVIESHLFENTYNMISKNGI